MVGLDSHLDNFHPVDNFALSFDEDFGTHTLSNLIAFLKQFEKNFFAALLAAFFVNLAFKTVFRVVEWACEGVHDQRLAQHFVGAKIDLEEIERLRARLPEREETLNTPKTSYDNAILTHATSAGWGERENALGITIENDKEKSDKHDEETLICELKEESVGLNTRNEELKDMLEALQEVTEAYNIADVEMGRQNTELSKNIEQQKQKLSVAYIELGKGNKRLTELTKSNEKMKEAFENTIKDVEDLQFQRSELLNERNQLHNERDQSQKQRDLVHKSLEQCGKDSAAANERATKLDEKSKAQNEKINILEKELAIVEAERTRI